MAAAAPAHPFEPPLQLRGCLRFSAALWQAGRSVETSAQLSHNTHWTGVGHSHACSAQPPQLPSLHCDRSELIQMWRRCSQMQLFKKNIFTTFFSSLPDDSTCRPGRWADEVTSLSADEARAAFVSGAAASPPSLQSCSVVAAVGGKPPLCLSGLSGWVLRRLPLPYSLAALHAACMQLTE